MTMKEEQQPNSLGQTLENHNCIKLGLLSIVQKPIRLCLIVLFRLRFKKMLCKIIFGPKNFGSRMFLNQLIFYGTRNLHLKYG